MNEVKYCSKCQRVFYGENSCKFCGCEKTKQLKKNAPVNILGTKLKGKVYNIKKDEATLIITNSDTKERYMKEYNVEDLKKII